ncbi:MAG: exopolysaccharide biosynthesis polyprenyl glycosylphosphotransferase [Bacteroidota bacterium]
MPYARLFIKKFEKLRRITPQKYVAYRNLIMFGLGILDLMVVVVSFLMSLHLFRIISGVTKIHSDYWIMAGLILALYPFLLRLTNLPKVPRTTVYFTIFIELFQVNIIGLVMLFIFRLLFGLAEVSVLMLTGFFIINNLSIYLHRVLTYKVFKVHRSHGHNLHNVLVIADQYSDLFIDRLIHNKEWGFRVIMVLSNSKLIRAKYGSKLKILSENVNIKSLLKHDIIDEIVYSKKKIDREKVAEIVSTSREIGVIFRMQSELSPLQSFDIDLREPAGMPVLNYINLPSDNLLLFFKNLSDLIFSGLMLLFLSPVLLLLALAIKIDSPGGPVFFKQERVGKRGRKFMIYKFRTMVPNAEQLRKELEAKNEMDGPVFKMTNDPRITKIGHILRKTGLDELPQLLNVFRGEMSMIGPRPPLPSEVEQYETWQLRRLSVKPGITCTWQIIPNRNSVSFEKWMKLDLNYIDNWSIIEDFTLLFKTIRTVFSRSGL